MMQKLRNPKNVKLISLFIAAIFVLGCFALSVTQSGVGKSAFAASSESAIGVVNYQMLVAQSPDLSKVNEAMNKEIESAQKDFNEKSKTMNEAEKRKTTGRRNGGRNIWKRKNFATIFSARDKQRNLSIFKDSNGILKIIPFIEIWF